VKVIKSNTYILVDRKVKLGKFIGYRGYLKRVIITVVCFYLFFLNSIIFLLRSIFLFFSLLKCIYNLKSDNTIPFFLAS
jgi:hypothetical protein